MDAMSGISGGNDTIYLSAKEWQVLAGRQRQAAARGNLAAMLVERAGGLEAVEADETLAAEVAGEFVEVCEVLGLNPPPAPGPGTCRRVGCDNAIAITRGRGFCSMRCERISYMPTSEDVE